MICKIADLFVDVPAAGGMSPRCAEYASRGNGGVDIRISVDGYRKGIHSGLSEEDRCYLESGFQFHKQLLYHAGMMLHSSAVEMGGRAFLFSAPSGTGKSTHTKIWQQIFGEAAQVFNDDKPALRRLEGTWFAYGTPWCGKDGINQNKKVPLAGVCFLKRGDVNRIRRLSPVEAVSRALSQTPHRFYMVERLDLMLDLVDHLVREIPMYELECLPDEDAARLSCETMLRGAEEAGL